jgi:hypothetical protein
MLQSVPWFNQKTGTIRQSVTCFPASAPHSVLLVVVLGIGSSRMQEMMSLSILPNDGAATRADG